MKLPSTQVSGEGRGSRPWEGVAMGGRGHGRAWPRGSGVGPFLENTRVSLDIVAFGSMFRLYIYKEYK